MLHFNLPVVFILVAAVVASGGVDNHQSTHPSRTHTPGPAGPRVPLKTVPVPVPVPVVHHPGSKQKGHLQVDTSGSSSKAGGATGGPAEGPQSSRSFTSSMYASDSAHSKGTTEEKRVKPKLRIEISQVKLTPNRKQPAAGPPPGKTRFRDVVRNAIDNFKPKVKEGELKGDAKPVAQLNIPKLPGGPPPRSPYDKTNLNPYPLRRTPGPHVPQNPDPLSAVSANSGSKDPPKPVTAEEMRKKAHRKARVYGALPGTPEAHSPTPEVHIPNQDGADPIPNPPQPQAPPPRRGDLTVDGVFGKASTLDTGKKPKAPWKP